MDNTGEFLGFLAGFTVVLGIVTIGVIIFFVISLSKVFDKCGEPKWAAWVPYYNTYVLTKICGLHWMYVILVLASSIVAVLGIDKLESLADLVTLYGLYMCWYNLSKKFNQGVGFSIGLLFLPFIFVPILGFSKNYTYDSSVAVSEHGVFGTASNSNTGSSSVSPMDKPAATTGDNISELVGSNVAFCPGCGTKVNPEVDRFCPNCGKEITK